MRIFVTRTIALIVCGTAILTLLRVLDPPLWANLVMVVGTGYLLVDMALGRKR